MRTIENILDENRSALDQIELPEGHRERMQARLAATARKRHRLHIALWISSASAVAAVIALALWITPINTATEQQPLTAEQIEALEVEQYYREQRDRAIDEVREILENNNSAAAAQISYDLAELKLNFEADPLPRNMFENDTKKYIALTIARLTAQKEVVNQMKHSITNI